VKNEEKSFDVDCSRISSVSGDWSRKKPQLRWRSCRTGSNANAACHPRFILFIPTTGRDFPQRGHTI